MIQRVSVNCNCYSLPPFCKTPEKEKKKEKSAVIIKQRNTKWRKTKSKPTTPSLPPKIVKVKRWMIKSNKHDSRVSKTGFGEREKPPLPSPPFPSRSPPQRSLRRWNSGLPLGASLHSCVRRARPYSDSLALSARLCNEGKRRWGVCWCIFASYVFFVVVMMIMSFLRKGKGWSENDNLVRFYYNLLSLLSLFSIINISIIITTITITSTTTSISTSNTTTTITVNIIFIIIITTATTAVSIFGENLVCVSVRYHLSISYSIYRVIHRRRCSWGPDRLINRLNVPWLNIKVIQSNQTAPTPLGAYTQA